jgi:hypothetical protein
MYLTGTTNIIVTRTEFESAYVVFDSNVEHMYPLVCFGMRNIGST